MVGKHSQSKRVNLHPASLKAALRRREETVTIEAMKLSTLPVDLLSHLLLFTVGSNALSLWKCGDRSLNYKLSNGAVLEVALVDNNPLSTSRWPRALSNFRKMRSLSILRRHGRLDAPKVIRTQLQLLPPTLESLRLAFWEVPEALLCAAESDFDLDDFFSNASLQPSSGDLTPEIPETSPKIRMWNLGEAFPRLETLWLSDFTRQSSYCPFTSSDLAQLPRSLTTLHLYIGSGLLSTNFSQLPPGIRTFQIRGSEALSDKELLTIPPSLTSLEILGQRDYAGVLNHFHSALVSILPWRASSLDVDMFRSDWKWSPHLQSLCIWNSEPKLPSLPSTLTKLRIALFDLPAGLLRSLPQTLEILFLKGLDSWEGVTPRDWPKLKQLNFKHGASSLTTSVFHCLPRSLQSLDINPLAFSDKDAPNTFSMTLDEIRAEMADSRPNDPLPPQFMLDSLMQGRHFGLPLNLRSLRIYTREFGGLIDFCPPPFVDHLRLPPSFYLDMSKFAGMLPLSLRLLLISGARHASRTETITEFKTAAQHLTTISLNASCDKFSSSIFADLPRMLITLTIICQASKTLVPEDLKNLPQGLKRFECNLEFDTSSITPDRTYFEGSSDTPSGWQEEMTHIPRWLGFLPRSIVDMEAYSLHARSEDLCNMPPRMSRLMLAKVAEMTLPLFRTLPSTLSYLEANFVPTLKHMRLGPTTVLTTDQDEEVLPPLLHGMKLGAPFAGLCRSRYARIHRQETMPLPPLDPRAVVTLKKL